MGSAHRNTSSRIHSHWLSFADTFERLQSGAVTQKKTPIDVAWSRLLCLWPVCLFWPSWPCQWLF